MNWFEPASGFFRTIISKRQKLAAQQCLANTHLRNSL